MRGQQAAKISQVEGRSGCKGGRNGLVRLVFERRAKQHHGRVAVSSVQLTLVMFACAYVAGAASRVSGVEEGDLIYLVGGTFWPFALLGAVSFYLECVKYLEAVVGTSSRRNM